MSGNIPLSLSPPPITTTTPGSTTNSVSGQRPKLSLHIPDDEDPTQQADESGGSATPGTASPEVNRSTGENGGGGGGVKSERSSSHDDRGGGGGVSGGPSTGGRRHSDSEAYFLPPPNSASSLLPNGGRLPGPGLGAYDNSNNSGGTPLSALPSRYAGDMLPSPSTFYPEFYGNLPSAGTSNLRSGFSGMMNGTPVVARADESGGGGFGGYGGNGGGGGEKRRSTDELSQGANKRARS
jgi:MADS-box transcription factor